MMRVKLTLVSLPWVALLVGAYFSGWVHQIVVGDTSRISIAIAAISVVTVGNAIVRGARPETLDFIGDMAVTLGLIGTVLGFIEALLSVNPETVTHVENIAPMVANLIAGMGVALYTTLVGSFFYLWLAVLQRIIEPEG